MKRVRSISILVVLMSLMVLLSGVIQAAEYDFGGKPVTIFHWGGPNNGRFIEGGDAEGLHEVAEEEFNTEIIFDHYAFSEYAEGFMTRLLAGDSTNDLWLMQQRQFWQLVSQGAFYPVADVVAEEYYESLPELPRAMAEALNYQGKTYGFGVDYGAVHPLEFTMYNKDIFEREGLPDLYELYKAGEWTWEKQTEIAIEATRDTDGDGEIDQWGLGEYYPSRLIWLSYTNGARVTRETENGRMEFTFDEPAALETMKLVQEWNTVHNVLASGSWQDFANGDVAMRNDGIYVINIVNQNMEEDFGVVPLPRGPREEVHRYPAHALISWVLPANVEDPEALVALQEYLWPIEEYDEKLEDYFEARVRDRNSFEVLMTGHDNWAGEVMDLEYVILSNIWGPMTEVMNGEKQPAAAMEEIKPEVQAILDELFNTN